ncbi:AraC family transcriptional regulator [Robiginitalea sp. SC105]|uniref:helix-turn-helix domain-containing protein n=1 Tax=Robiginitalea sp. SC105 TaxID=2762332 RepID=UPI00163A8844|nr:AraC family transcriptional regulator [Robiginitalea sp. SC105]MBC2837774.1 helix-turn-helix transcriptional regulator [Robiginitalea sp. SC105]
MFTLPIGSATSLLEQFGRQLRGEYKGGFEEGLLVLDNDIGKGRLRAVNLPDDLSTLIYDVTFYRDLTFRLSGEESRPLFFLFCLEGYFYHHYESQKELRRVSKLQNVILSGSSENRSIIRIPADTKLKISVIWLLRTRLEPRNGSPAPRTTQKLVHILEGMNGKASYFGSLRPATARYVSVLIDNTKPGVVGRLLTEAAILNILASQLDHYRKTIRNEPSDAPLGESEIGKILELGNEIVGHLDRDYTVGGLSVKSGLNPKKLQAGFRYLYGSSVSNFIRDARLERARELLETRGMNVSEAVYAVGLSSRSYFTKAFKERYGIRPSDLLARLKS